MAEKLKLGIIGCGMISDIYLKNIADMFGDRLQAVACADIVEEKVRACARKYGIRAESVDELLADGEVEGGQTRLQRKAARNEIFRGGGAGR